VRTGLDLSDSGYGPIADACEHDTATTGYANGGEFLHQILDYVSKRIPFNEVK
jgi:hypothetical protein